MDLRTKLVFLFVAVSLVSMLALGAYAYRTADESLNRRTRRQLDSLAETKKDDLQKVILGWKDRVALIASRTQLRYSLHEYNRSGDSEQQERIKEILTDARQASQVVQSLVVFDWDGRPVATDAGAPESEFLESGLAPLPAAADSIGFQRIYFTAEDEPRVSLVSSLILEDRPIGTLHVVLSAEELVELSRDSTGLGRTGETMIVMRDSAGVLRVLHPVRHRTTQRPDQVLPGGPSDPAARAFRGEEGPFTEGLFDYRGEPVWAATRYLPEVNLGIVVKFDAGEERESIREFRRRLTQFGFSLAAFAILLGTILGLRIANPIHNLSEVANKIRLGKLDARAKVTREDELGLLAHTFNQMAEELEQKVTLLHEFRKYFELSLDMLCIAGTDGYFRRVNPAFERTLGWSTKELLSKSFMDFVHPDDVVATSREIEKLSQGIPTISFENRYSCADGSYKRLLWTSYPEPETGLLYAIARDITDPHGIGQRATMGDDPAGSA